jgi:hypothetical protein
VIRSRVESLMGEVDRVGRKVELLMPARWLCLNMH